MALRSLALCAGVGGLDLGVKLARPDHRLVGVVERQAYCAAVLVARMADSSVDQAPIWDDLTTFDCEPWRGCVDLVTAGFPCQPVSVAGQRGGQADERWLWPQVWRVARGVGARYLFVENVPGLLSLGLADILGDLAAGGWDAEWDCVPAAAVGAPHLRDRFFLLAADARRGLVGDTDESKPFGGATVRPALATLAVSGQLQPPPTPRHRGAAYGTESGRHSGTTLTDATVRASHARGSRHEGPIVEARLVDGSIAADADEFGQFEGERDVHARQPDAARGGDTSYWDDAPAPEPVFRRVDDGAAGRVDLDRDWAERIHALGNAVVRQAAARAWETLWNRLMVPA